MSTSPTTVRDPIHTAPAVCNLADIRITDADGVGGKGANLGELIAAGLPVPPGFVLACGAYRTSMQVANVDTELAALHREALDNVDDSARLDELCTRMRSLVLSAGLTDEVRRATVAAYHALGARAVVAVRSSAAGEDGRDASFAGMNRSITNIAGEQELVDAVTACWASLFTPRVLTYRASRNFTNTPEMAVVVQRMIFADRAGVAFTADPSTGNRGHLVVEAAFGQGEVVVSGKVQPDTYVIDKATRRVIDIHLGTQPFKIVRGDDGHDAVGAEIVGQRVEHGARRFGVGVDDDICAEFARRFQTGVGCIDGHDGTGTVQPRREYGGQPDRAGTDDGDDISGPDHSIQHAHLVGGWQDVGQHDHLLVGHPIRHFMSGVVGEGNPDILGLGTVDQMTENPAAAPEALPVA